MTEHGLVNSILALLIMPMPLQILHLNWLMCSAQLILMLIIINSNAKKCCRGYLLNSIIINFKFCRFDMFSVGCSKYYVLGLINV